MIAPPSRFVRVLLPALFGAASLSGFGVSSALADAPSGVAPVPPGLVVGRTDYSTTAAAPDGERTTWSFPQAVNFQTDSGAWKAVDPTLEHAADGTVHPRELDGDASIPSTLSRPVEIAHDDRSLAFRLRAGAADPAGDRAIDGPTAGFDDAIDGVDVNYTARSAGLKETLKLESASSPRVFTYDVAADADLSAAVDVSGDVVFTDASGAEKFRVSAPLAWDSSTPAAYSDALTLSVVKQSAGHWALTMHLDNAWLDDSARQFPVFADPDVIWTSSGTKFHGATQDCYLTGGSLADHNDCAAGFLQVGSFGTKPYRAELRFDVTAGVPADANVSSGLLAMYLGAGPGAGTPLQTRASALTSEWDNNATWNSRKTGTPWTTPGGDVSSTLRSSPTTVYGTATWNYWNLPIAAVRGWVTGSLANYGVQVASVDESVKAQPEVFYSTDNTSNPSLWPYLAVSWTPHDSTPPALTLSGPAIDNAASWQTASSSSVTLSATDAGVGVTRLQVKNGSTVIGDVTQPCAAGACSFANAFTLDLSALPEGVANLSAVATDANGNVTTTPFTVRVDRAAPTLGLSGTLVDDQSTTATTGTRAVAVHATDAGAGVTLATLSVDGVEKNRSTQACAAGGCSLDASWTVDVGALSDGPHDVTVVATDGAGRSTTQHLTVTTDRFAMPAVPPLSQTTGTPYLQQVNFLWTGSNPLQTGVAPGTINARQSAVIEGKVFNGEGVPAAGVTVTVVDHPEYGQTLSRDDGSYWLGVNGGGQLRVHFAVQGALPSERAIDVKWNDYNRIDDVWLVTPDSRGTDVTFSSAQKTMQVASATPVSDAAGTRTTRVFIEKETTAQGQEPDGTLVDLPLGTMRMTEYTVGGHGPERMPAALPDSTAYTWASEFQIDQASEPQYKHVLFSKPLVTYVDNFLHFPVGMNIPVGTYESDKGNWAANPDGRVIKIVDIVGGEAVVDVTGFGPATDQERAYYGFTDDELTKLAQTYHVGDTLMRTQMTHFSRADLNVGIWIKKIIGLLKGPKNPENNCDCNAGGSIIGVQNQTLGEPADLIGTPYSLRYDTERTPGAAGPRSVDVPLTDSHPDPDLARVDVDVVIAGQLIQYSEDSPAPNTTHTFHWDGKDVFNRTMVGGATADVTVREVFPAPYSNPTFPMAAGSRADWQWVSLPYFENGASLSWGMFGGGSPSVSAVYTPETPSTQPTTRPTMQCDSTETHCTYPVDQATDPRPMPLSREGEPIESHFTVALPYLDARTFGVGGWSVSALHHYDVNTGTLFTGDGSFHPASALPDVIKTFKRVDGPGPTYAGGTVASIAVMADGSVIGTDAINHRILRTTTDGVTSVFVDLPENAVPNAVAVGPDGSAYISDNGNAVIDKVTPGGTLSVFAGNGTGNEGADLTNPLDRALTHPQALGVSHDGTVWIGDVGGLLTVSPGGKATRIGSIEYQRCGHAWDECQFYTPPVRQIAVAPDGTVYWHANNGPTATATVHVYRYNPEFDNQPTTIETGNPQLAINPGDFATSNLVPSGLTVDPQGRLILTESSGDHATVWRVGSDGRVAQIGEDHASTPDPSTHLFGGENGPFRSAGGQVRAIAQGPQGLVVMDQTAETDLRVVAPATGRYPLGTQLIASPDGSEVYQFDDTGRQLATLNGTTGRTIRTFDYDTGGHLAAIHETDSGTTTFAPLAGHPGVIAVTGPDGKQTQITVGTDGYATAIKDPAGHEQHYTYGADGLMASQTDELGHTSTFAYGPTGRLLTDTSKRGNVQTLSRVNGATTTVTHTLADGETSTYQSSEGDDNSQTTTFIAPDGSVSTQKVSDLSTRPVSTTTAADGTITTDSSAPNSDSRLPGANPQTNGDVKLPSGLEVQGGSSETVTHDAGDDPNDPFAFHSLIDTYKIDGRTSTSTYDRAARTETATSSVGRQVTVHYDDHDRPDTVSSAGRADTTFAYDNRSRPTSVTQGASTSKTSYGTDGFVDSDTDPLNHVTRYTRDADGQVTSETDPDGSVTGTTYDAAGQVTSVTAPDNRVFTFGYDADGNVTSATRGAIPTKGTGQLTASVEYNAAGQPTKATAASGATVDVHYDSAGRVTNTHATDGSDITLSYQATGGRLLNSATTGDGVTTSMTYDGSVPTGSSTTGDGDGSDAAPVHLTYDTSARPITETISGNNQLDYTYNNDDQITNAGPVHIDYNAQSGDPTALTAGATNSYVTFDSRGNESTEQSVVTNSGVQSGVFTEALTRNLNDQITARSEQIGSGTPQTQNYTYDPMGRLTGVTANSVQTETYGYDSTGGLISRGDGILTDTFATDKYGRPVSTTSGLAASWTTDGELSQLTRPGIGQSQLTYDGFGRIKRVTLPDGTVGTYTYDGMGRRSALRVAGAIQRRYVFTPGNLFPTARVTASGDVLEQYVYATANHVPEVIVRRDGTKLRIITDAAGSVRAVVDIDTGQVVQRLAYDAYGRVTQDTAPGTQPFGFKGAMTDPVAEGAGLIWMGTRAYVPSLARFATPDPAGIAAAWNEHDAFGGDPINLIDTDGLAPEWLWHLSDFAAGVGDGATLGVTSWIRDQIGGNENVNKCSSWYHAGWWAGLADSIVAGPWLLGKAVGALGKLGTRIGQIFRGADAGGGASAAGRDALGRFTGAGGYGAEAEGRGIAAYEQATGSSVIRTQVRASLSEGGGGRFYDGLVRNADGTFTGIEVKSGSATLSASQRAFDAAVNGGQAAKATLNGEAIEITSTHLVRVQ